MEFCNVGLCMSSVYSHHRSCVDHVFIAALLTSHNTLARSCLHTRTTNTPQTAALGEMSSEVTGFVTAMHAQVQALRSQLAAMQDGANRARCDAYAAAAASKAVVSGTAEVCAKRNKADAHDIIAAASEFATDE